LRHAKALGFSHVDLRAQLDGGTIDNISMEAARELRGKLDEFELEVGSISSWAVNTCSFAGPPPYRDDDEAHHQAMSAVLERLFDLADIFRAPYVRIYSLYREEGFDQLPQAEQDAQFRYNADVMRRHAEHARTRNKTVLVENEPPTLTCNAREPGLLVKYADHPHLKINWDIVNGWRAGEYPTVEAYEPIKGHVRQTHLKGAVRASNSRTADHPQGRFGNFAIAGQDDFDYGPLMQAISMHDPHAIMTIDTHYPSLYVQDKIGEIEVVRRTKRYLESLIQPGNGA